MFHMFSISRKSLLFYWKNQSFYHTSLQLENPKEFLQICSTTEMIQEMITEIIKDNQVPGFTTENSYI